MHSPQVAIFSEAKPHRMFLTFNCPMPVDRDALSDALSEIRVNDDVDTLIAFGPKLTTLLAIDTPDNFDGYKTISSTDGRFHSESTQADLFIFIQGNQSDLFDASYTAVQALATTCDLIDETYGFDYRDSQDLMQFEDGSANPKGAEIALAALVPETEPGASGSIILAQKWQHDLASFDELDDYDQSRVIGRDKETNEELSGDAMPSNAHVAKTDLSLDGTAAKVYRRSSPYGTATNHGLYFLSFACDQRRHQLQLDSMFGLTDGITDRILEFSKPLQNHYFFAPSAEVLDSI